MNVAYWTTAVATGDGRNGRTQTEDGSGRSRASCPRELGGEGGKANPRQFFAAGYAACFHSAPKMIASRDALDSTGSQVSAKHDTTGDERSAYRGAPLGDGLPRFGDGLRPVLLDGPTGSSPGPASGSASSHWLAHFDTASRTGPRPSPMGVSR